MSNIMVTVVITGPSTATISNTLPGPLSNSAIDTLTVGTFNSFPGGSYTFTIYTSHASEQFLSNDTIVVTRSILVPPQPALGADTAICAGSSFVLNPGAGGTSYLWSTTAVTPTISVSTAGTYSVTVTDAAGCSGTDAIIITISPAASGTFTIDTTLCPIISFAGSTTAGTGPFTWSWTFGDGGTASTQNPNHDYTGAGTGTYTVTLIVSNACGADTIVTPVGINCMVGIAKITERNKFN